MLTNTDSNTNIHLIRHHINSSGQTHDCLERTVTQMAFSVNLLTAIEYANGTISYKLVVLQATVANNTLD